MGGPSQSLGKIVFCFTLILLIGNILNTNYQNLIFKFREDKSNNLFREIRKCFRKTAKFKYFAKQIIYLESPDHVLQNDI